MSRLARALLVSLCAAAATVSAQDPRFRGFGGGWGEGSDMPPRFASETDFDGRFNFCRLMYRSVRRHQRGLGWGTDYPHADMNLSIRLGELTRTRVSLAEGEPNHFVVRPTEEALSQCPFVMMSDPGTVGFTDEEVTALRAYLLKGGFLWADDYWGPWAWRDFAREIGRVLPPDQYPIKDLAADHPIFKTMFEVDHVPQVPSIQFWWYSGHETSEMGADSAVPHMAAISDSRGRVMVLMTHNTDIGDSWEREAEDPDFFYHFSPQGYAVGVNVVLYSMSH